MGSKQTDSKRIESVQVYRSKYSLTGKRQIRFYNVFFAVLYLYQLAWVVRSIGEPYRAFLLKAEREGFAVMEGTTRYRAELEHAIKDIDDEGRRNKKLGWFAWMDMDIEELAEEKKRDKQKTVLDSLPKSMRVPGKYETSFWPTLLLGVYATLHAFVLLMQHWSVGFNVAINYQEVDVDVVLEGLPETFFDLPPASGDELDGDVALKKNDKGERIVFPDRKLEVVPAYLPTHARIVPAKGRHVLVPLQYYPVLGMTFEYHRRRYIYDGAVWSKIRCHTDFDIDLVVKNWSGFEDSDAIVAAQIRFGPNMFQVSQPSFMDLYKKQLLNPFSVFQIFCVLLWAIDDYITYSLFSLGMVLMFEGVVVMQRIKSLQSLTNMGNPSRPVGVFRLGRWSSVDSAELLPGDIFSLIRVQPHRDDASRKIQDDGGDLIPADVLLLRGSTVVNEASLTGESVPQMKEGISEIEEGEDLSMKGKHKMNVAYAGTKMLQCKPSEEDAVNLFPNIPPPPDNGCVCFVLRTGFASAQGKLVRMIEGSQEKVKGHERETGLLLLVLCVFAIMGSSYVLYHGIQNENRSKYELLLHCILIITSVIRPELPMQMAMAVNNSIMTLMKLHVFCTEPYRVPVAGKLNVCLFDKTGTLTTDELVAVGVLADTKSSELTPMAKINGSAALVLAGCHSLVVYDNETTGDPLESASLKALRWQISEKSGNAEPAAAHDQVPAGQLIHVNGSKISGVEIKSRHHFSSKLQRMSCVIRASSKYYAVAKGSPEAVGKLLAEKPSGFDAKAEFLAKQGYRVIALAYKGLGEGSDIQNVIDSRAACESALKFAGFIAFTCMVRKDTAEVLGRLKDGGMGVAMVTGDALLTAIHVAKEVEICEPVCGSTNRPGQPTSKEIQALLAKKSGKKAEQGKVSREFKPILFLKKSDSGSLVWCSYDDNSDVVPYKANAMPDMAKRYDLATTGTCLNQAYEDDLDTHKHLGCIKVFARMTPVAKESVIESLHSVGTTVMMCGDGANDVGALKQADVGVALLSGFSNMNVDRPDDEKEKKENAPVVTAVMSQEHLNQIRSLPVAVIKMHIRKYGTDPSEYPELVEKEDLVQLYQIAARQAAVKQHEAKAKKEKTALTKAEKQSKKKEEAAELQRKMIERTKELEEQGVAWAQFKAMREVMAESLKEKKQQASKYSGVEGQAAALAAQLDDIGTGDLPMVKLGDASIAAPFTSKMPSIRNCVDIVRQGRCTLVSSMQMYQIMALQCLISSYSLSVLYLDGVKYGDTQMTAMGLLGSVSFMSVSRSKPLEKLSSVQPLSSIFHPASFISLLGQFAIHLGTMILLVQSAKSHLPKDYEADLDGQFKPGILNTVVFLVSNVQQVTVFFVNLQGRPFMTGIAENTPLLWSLAGTFILTFMFASESVPQMNRYFQLVPFPDDSFRDYVLSLLVLDLVGTFLFDRIMKFVFARHILIASFRESRYQDFFSLIKTFAIVGFLMYSFLGNGDQWDELIAMEEAAANGTLPMDQVRENISGAAETVLDVGAGSLGIDEL